MVLCNKSGMYHQFSAFSLGSREPRNKILKELSGPVTRTVTPLTLPKVSPQSFTLTGGLKKEEIKRAAPRA